MDIKQIKLLFNETFPVINDEVHNSGDGWIKYISGKTLEHPNIKKVKSGSKVTYMGFTITDKTYNRFLVRICHDFLNENDIRMYFDSKEVVNRYKLRTKKCMDNLRGENPVNP